jgi:hypothetical protein
MPITKTGGGGGGAGGGGSVTLIDTVTLAGAGTIDFTSIPSKYEDLIAVLMLRAGGSNGVGELGVHFNGDNTDGNYNSVYLQGVNSLTISGGSNTPSIAHWVPDASASAGRFGYVEVVIPGYASTLWDKLAISESGVQSATITSLSVMSNTVFWANTAAINEVKFYPFDSPGTFLAGSTGRLYGRT